MKPTKAISAISTASSLSDAQIKSLLIPHVVARQKLGLFYPQRIIFGTQHAFRDLSLPCSLCCAGSCCRTVSPVTTFRDHLDDTCWKAAASRAVSALHTVMPSGCAFCWLPIARATHNVNRAF